MLTIGEFSRLTHLSVRMLRRYCSTASNVAASAGHVTPSLHNGTNAVGARLHRLA